MGMIQASQVALAVKNLPANAEGIRDWVFDPWVGKVPLEEGMDPLQDSCLE